MNQKIPTKRGDFLLVLQSILASTIYPDPTGQAPVPLALTYRGSAAAAASPFATAGRSVVLKSIHIKRSSAAGSLLQIQSHAGVLIDAVGAAVGGGAADQDILYGDGGVNIPGGFRCVVTGGAMAATIVYAVEKSITP